MNSKQMLVFLMLVSIVRGAVIQNERNRTKRTLHYFLDGIYSALNQEKRLAAARVSNEQKSSSPIIISILSKLSSFSTRKNFNDLEDDTEENTNSLLLGNTNQKTFAQMQLPIPTMRTVKEMEMDTSSNEGTTRLSLLTSTTQITSTSTTTPKSSKIESSQSISQESAEKSSEIASSDETTSNPNELNTIESNEYETTIEDSSTMEPSLGTSFDDTETTTVRELEAIEKNSNIDDAQPKRTLYSDIHPFSNRHTTQSFGSPLIVERHREEEYSPMYLDNCTEINCLDDAENSKEIRPYIVPTNFHQHKALLIIPIAYALQPTPIRRIHARSNQKRLHYDPYYVWSQSGQPIMHIHQPHIQVYGGKN